MSGSRRFLDVDEDVLVDTRPHWSFLTGPVVALLVASAGAVAVVATFPDAPVSVAYGLGGVVIVALLWVVGRVVRWLSTRLLLTDRRLIFRQGVWGRSSTQLRLSRIAEIHCRQGLWDRLVRGGELVVDVLGEESGVRVDHVRDPWAFQSLVVRQLDRYDTCQGPWNPGGAVDPRTPRWSEPAPPTGWSETPTPPHGVRGLDAPGAAPSIPQQLVQLDGLRRRGILSDVEFEAKKAQLLSRF